MLTRKEDRFSFVGYRLGSVILRVALLSAPALTLACPAQIPATAPSAATAAPRNSQRSKQNISYRGGLLTVVAEDASLTQLVREIARETGMKVTGRVSDDHVFGVYGPASPSSILTALLDGSGSNLLIVQNAQHIATELILTPRVGGATPPNPNAQYAHENAGVVEPVTPTYASPPVPPSQASFNSRSGARSGTGGMDTNPAATSPSSISQQLAFPPIDSSTPPATATTTPATPDAVPATVRTPQQIFEQLQKLRQQQAQQPQPQPQ